MSQSANTDSHEFRAFAAEKQGYELSVIKCKAKPLGPKDVAVNVTHCGICHSDLHKINDEWVAAGASHTHYPCVPGHEVIGTIVAVGSDVKDFKVGQRVGFGPERDSCGKCDSCAAGDENLCAGFVDLYDPETGGYAEHIRVNSRFTFLIPDEIPSEYAGPLMCAGVTVFSPLVNFKLKPGSNVGIIGIGGLGHLAIQFASKLGHHVTVFSSSAGKEDEAKAFGATKFVHLGAQGALKANIRTQDFILCTASVNLDWEKYLNLLKPDGRLCLLGIPSEKISFGAFSVLGGRRSVSGSPIGGTRDMKEMLAFAAKHKIFPTIEKVHTKFDDPAAVNKAIQHVLSGKARYRAVLCFDN